MKENRKLISWRIEKLEQTQQDTINDWLDNQQNIQQSLTNVVLHMINRFGTTDIMNYENQKALYTNPENEPIAPKTTDIVEIIEEKPVTEVVQGNVVDTKEPNFYEGLGDEI